MEVLDVVWRALVAPFLDGFTFELARYAIAAGALTAVTLALWRVWLKDRKLQRRSATFADYRRDILASIRTVAVFGVVTAGTDRLAAMGWFTIYTDFSVKGPVYLVVTLVAMIIAHDAYYYWTHRAMHHPLLFRRFHWTHHKAKTPTPWTAYAFDVPEAVVMVAFVEIWSFIVPMHIDALVAFMTWQIIRNVMGHAGVELSPVSGRPSRWFGWLTTTTHHDLHHQAPRSNYGLYFTYWDRWMGTEHAEYQGRLREVAECSRAARSRAGRGGRVAVGPSPLRTEHPSAELEGSAGPAGP